MKGGQYRVLSRRALLEYFTVLVRLIFARAGSCFCALTGGACRKDLFRARSHLCRLAYSLNLVVVHLLGVLLARRLGSGQEGCIFGAVQLR